MPSLSCYIKIATLKSSYDKTAAYSSLLDSKTNQEIGCIINRLETKIFGDNDSYLLTDSTYTIYDLENSGQGSFTCTNVLGGNIPTIPTSFQSKTGTLDGCFVTKTNNVTVFGVPDFSDPLNIKVNISIHY